MKNLLILAFLLTALSGCSIFMPYHETFICAVPEGRGYCGSLTDGYEYSINMDGQE